MGLAHAFQTAIRSALVADAGVTALVGSRVYDNAPEEAETPHIAFGPTAPVWMEGDHYVGREEAVQIDVWAAQQGRMQQAKDVVDAVVAALRGLTGDLGEGQLVDTVIEGARVMRDPDGIHAHGVIQVIGLIDEDGA